MSGQAVTRKVVDSTKNPPRTLRSTLLIRQQDPYMLGRARLKGGYGYIPSDSVTYGSIEQSYRPLTSQNGLIIGAVTRM